MTDWTSAGAPPELSPGGLTALGPGNDCDREPIHLSGAIQPHGFLVAVDARSLKVAVVSANLSHFVAQPPALALNGTLSDLVGASLAERVSSLASTTDLSENGPLTVELPAPTAHSRDLAAAQPGEQRFELVLHRSGDELVLEFEPAEIISDEGLLGFYQATNRAMNRMHERDDVASLCETAVTELRQLTGYDRVMVYRFDQDAHGHVVAEACRPDQERFLGLHYPAGDIPRQARLLYLRNALRLIVDVGYTPVPLVSSLEGPTAAGLDLSLSSLRSVSPMHVQYLANMGVGATMTISLIVNGRLWGMIACHHDEPKRVSHHVRKACETLGQLLSLQLRAAQTASDHDHAAHLAKHAAQVVTALAAGETLTIGALAVPDAFTGMVGAEGAVLQVGGQRVTLGSVPPTEALDYVVAVLAHDAQDHGKPMATDCLTTVLEEERPAGALPVAPDLRALAETAAGALYVPLGHRDGDFVVWLRGEQSRTVRWAGAPDAKAEGGPLTPRASFAEWREVVSGRSMPWLPVEMATAQEFALAYPELVLHRSKNRLVRLAMHDQLTGLPNRAMLLDRLNEALGKAAERPDSVLAVLFVDLDQFKAVNDSYGHEAGDGLLIDVAARLQAVVRPEDTVARISGDEFVILLPTLARTEQAIGIAQRVIEQCRTAFPLAPDVSASISSSVGVVIYDGTGDAAEVLRRADKALYHAKRAGRDQIRIYGSEHPARSEASRIETELRTALAEDQLVVHLQPVIRIQPGHPAADLLSAAASSATLHGVEALVRWQHPTRGLLGPDAFIPVAEEAGLIDAIGAHVLDRCLRELTHWRNPSLVCAVNASVREVIRPGFAVSVLQRLATHGVAPERLCLEITETQVMQRPEYVATVLAELRSAGVQIAIDDFGTGFSSLAYVRNLPAHQLKIDRTFVSGLPDNPRDAAVVASTVRLAHQLGMQTVGEGVETVEQLACLVHLGCDYAQGYLLGRPAPFEALDEDAPLARQALRAATTVNGATHDAQVAQ